MGQDILKEYEIYPIPHHITYLDGVVSLKQGVHVVFDPTIDEPTKNKVQQVLKDNGIPFEIGHTTSENQKLFLVGTVNSGGPVDQYAAQHMDQTNMDFEKIDAHQIEINDDHIIVLGKDTDASFYGVVTIEVILSQVNDLVVRKLRIQDYANTKIRGVIEGFYGIPWSHEDRISLMKFGAKFKANTFVFAPKDDPYHREKWQELYPEEMLEDIAELARLGNETKNRFVWTISPLGEVAHLARTAGQEAVMELLEENTERMLHKFDQLYDVGVRQFGVLGDDVGSLPLDYVVQLMDAVTKWVKAKGDVYNTLYCPASYNSAWAWIPSELNTYEKGFDKDIQIFWTGSTTCAPVEQSTIDVFKHKENDGIVRRDPLFWLNWPVNDVDMSRVFLGKGEMLQRNIQNLAGVVTNPMQEAEASKIAIFAICDYTWNTEDFDDQKSWEDSFKYIEPDAPEELHVLAKHMSDAHPNGIRTSESEDIKDQINTITEKVEKGFSIQEDAEGMIAELEHIAHMADQFLVKTKNEKLKEELKAFVLALRDMVLADVQFIQATLAIEEGDKGKAWNAFAQGLSLRRQSNNYDRPLLDGTMKTKPAQKRLQPFTNFLEEKVGEKVAELFEIEKRVQKATVFTNIAKYQDLPVKEDVYTTTLTCAEAVTLEENDYIGVKLSRVKDVIEIVRPSVKGGLLEVSANGYEWNAIDEQEEFRGAIRYIRFVNKHPEAMELLGTVLKVTSHEIQPKSVKDTNVEHLENPLALFDGDLGTHTYFRESQKAGKYVTYDLGQDITIHNIKAVVREAEHDFPRHALLEASLDGKQWTPILAFGNQNGPNEGEEKDEDRIDAIFDQLQVPYRIKEASNLDVTARYLRFTITHDKVGPDRWLRMQEIIINDGEYYPELNDPTATTDAAVLIGSEIDKLYDGQVNTYFKPGNNEAGFLLYHIGEVETKITGITILEDPTQLSESKVQVRTLDGWIELGKVESAYQYFATDHLPVILDLKLEWEKGKVPTIYEIKIDRVQVAN